MLASDGSARLDSRIGDRVVAAGQLIAPHIREEVIEGGTPVRYGGDAVGALVGRWAFGSPPDVARASVLLTSTSPPRSRPKNPTTAAFRRRRSRAHTSVRTAPSSSAVWHDRRISTTSRKEAVLPRNQYALC